MGTVASRVQRLRHKLQSPDALNAMRRRFAMAVDQAWVLTTHQWRVRSRSGSRAPDEFLSLTPVRFTFVTVNYSTTPYLKLMLLTLSEQEHLDLLHQVCVVDNGSVDGGVRFVRELARTTPKVALLERRRNLTHAHGLRAGLSMLGPAPTGSLEVVVICDTDVIFRRTDTLTTLAKHFNAGAALVGEHRGPPTDPDIQASFVAVRRDVLERPTVISPVHHGSPLLWMQRSIVRDGLQVAAFAGNGDGFVLHRGRSGVAAARTHRPRSPYGTALVSAPHFMGVSGGEAIWAETEARFAKLLDCSAERALIDHLRDRLA